MPTPSLLLIMSCTVTGTRGGVLVEDTPDTSIQEKMLDAFSLNSVLSYHERGEVGAAVVDYQGDVYNPGALSVGTVLVYRTHCRPEAIGEHFKVD